LLRVIEGIVCQRNGHAGQEGIIDMPDAIGGLRSGLKLMTRKKNSNIPGNSSEKDNGDKRYQLG